MIFFFRLCLGTFFIKKGREVLQKSRLWSKNLLKTIHHTRLHDSRCTTQKSTQFTNRRLKVQPYEYIIDRTHSLIKSPIVSLLPQQSRSEDNQCVKTSHLLRLLCLKLDMILDSMLGRKLLYLKRVYYQRYFFSVAYSKSHILTMSDQIFALLYQACMRSSVTGTR